MNRLIAVALALMFFALAPAGGETARFTPSNDRGGMRAGDVATVAIGTFLIGLIIYAIVNHHHAKAARR